MSEWQDIETAPKDGSQFLAWLEAAGAPSDTIASIRWKAGRGWWLECANQPVDYYEPANWRPLPEPPTDSARRG